MAEEARRLAVEFVKWHEPLTLLSDDSDDFDKLTQITKHLAEQLGFNADVFYGALEGIEGKLTRDEANAIRWGGDLYMSAMMESAFLFGVACGQVGADVCSIQRPDYLARPGHRAQGSCDAARGG